MYYRLAYHCCRQSTSSVARGEAVGLDPPIDLKTMQNSTFLVLLRPIFAPKIKTAPPKGFGSRSCEKLAVVWTRIVDFFGSRAHPKSVKTFFLDHLISAGKTLEFLISAGKTLWISVKTFSFSFFFFWNHLILTEKPPQSNVRLMKIWVKFVFGCIKLQKSLPPFCEILATRLQSIDNKVICSQCVHSFLIRISKFWFVTGCF